MGTVSQAGQCPAGCLTGLGLLFLNRYLPGVLFLAMGLSHLLAELRHTPYRLQDSLWMGLGLLLNQRFQP